MNRVEWEKGHSDAWRSISLTREQSQDYVAGWWDGVYSRNIRTHNLPLPCVTMTAKEAYAEYERRGLIPVIHNDRPPV